jgi:hypothetical protein
MLDMPMKIPAITALGLFLLVATGAAASEKPKALADIIYDKEGFIARLPKRTLTDPHFLDARKDIVDAEQTFAVALGALGSPKGVEFVELPNGFGHPAILASVPPEYPAMKANAEQAGHADFLMLIGRKGRISAIYCTADTDRLFAISGANALVQWNFAPAYADGQPLPVLVMMRMQFEMIVNGSKHTS